MIAPTISEGWRLVPIEPTEAMRQAWYDAWSHCTDQSDEPGEVWSAMLAAAPNAPASAHPVARFAAQRITEPIEDAGGADA